MAEFDDSSSGDDDDDDDTTVQPVYTEFNTLALDNMEKYDKNNPWTNITFHREHHGKKFKFLLKHNDNIIQAKINENNHHILLKQVFDCKLLSKITIQFTIKNRIENSIIGLIEYPLQYGHDDEDTFEELNIKQVGLYGDKPLEQSRFHQSYYGVGTQINKNEKYYKQFRIWTPNGHNIKQYDFGFNDGDKFIMNINFKDKTCSIYVNEINENYLITNDDEDIFTFNDIPQQFVILYGSHSIKSNEKMNEDETQKKRKKKVKIDIEVKLLEIIGRDVNVKRKKKKKPKRRTSELTMNDKPEIEQQLKGYFSNDDINDIDDKESKNNDDDNHKKSEKNIDKNERRKGNKRRSKKKRITENEHDEDKNISDDDNNDKEQAKQRRKKKKSNKSKDTNKTEDKNNEENAPKKLRPSKQEKKRRKSKNGKKDINVEDTEKNNDSSEKKSSGPKRLRPSKQEKQRRQSVDDAKKKQEIKRQPSLEQTSSPTVEEEHDSDIDVEDYDWTSFTKKKSVTFTPEPKDASDDDDDDDDKESNDNKNRYKRPRSRSSSRHRKEKDSDEDEDKIHHRSRSRSVSKHQKDDEDEDDDEDEHDRQTRSRSNSRHRKKRRKSKPKNKRRRHDDDEDDDSLNETEEDDDDEEEEKVTKRRRKRKPKPRNRHKKSLTTDDLDDSNHQRHKKKKKQHKPRRQRSHDDDDSDDEFDDDDGYQRKHKRKKRRKSKPRNRYRDDGDDDVDSPKHRKKRRKSKPKNKYRDDDDDEDENDSDYDRKHRRKHHKKKEKRHRYHEDEDEENTTRTRTRSRSSSRAKKKKRRSKNNLTVNNDDSDDSESESDNDRRHRHKKRKKKKKKIRRKSAQIPERDSKKLRRKKKKKESKKRRNSAMATPKGDRDSFSDFDIEDIMKNKTSNGFTIRLTQQDEPENSSPEEDDDDDDDDTKEYDQEAEDSFEPEPNLDRVRSAPVKPPPKAKTRRSSVKPPRPKAPPPSKTLLESHKVLDKLEMNVKPFDECYLLEKCLSIKRIKALLIFYQKILNQMHRKNDIIINYCSKYKHLLNDYHHILMIHLNNGKQENDVKFAMIYDMIMGNDDKEENMIKCDIKHCNSYIRNNQNRDNAQMILHKSRNSNDSNLQFYIDILDTIHCLFVHSYDCGVKIKLKELKDKNNNNDYKFDDEDEVMINAYSDYKLKQINEKLSDKYDFLSSIRGEHRMKIHKFNSDFRGYQNQNQNKNENQNEESSQSDLNLFPYNFGRRCYYWEYYKNNHEEDINYNRGYKYCDWYIDMKYSSLKQEIMNNKIFPLDRKQYDRVYNVALNMMNTDYVKCNIKQESLYSMYQAKQQICQRENADELYYAISSYGAITIEQIMSIIFYCDYIELNKCFKSTFKKLSHRNETDFQFKERNREFWHWAKLLRETIEVYGEWISSSKDNKFYTQLTTKIIFNEFNGNINSPISTTTELSVMILYGYSSKNERDCEYILELSENTDCAIGLFVKYFNCTFLSNFGYENECIFIGGWSPLKFSSIINIKTNHNYKCFLNAISIFKSAINGQRIKNKATKLDYILIDKLIRYEIGTNIKNNNIYPIYPTEIFHLIIETTKSIMINGYNINTSYPKLKKYFISPLTDIDDNTIDSQNMADLIAFDYITNLLTKCNKITVEMTNTRNVISQSFLSLLSPIIKQINDERTNLQFIEFDNIRNQCNDKDLKKFKSYLNSFKLNWALNITQSQRYQNKYFYTIFKKQMNEKKSTKTFKFWKK